LRKRTNSLDNLIENELNELEQERNIRKAKWTHMFTKKYLSRPLILLFILHLTDQLSGITVITYYSSKILIDFNVSKDIAQYASISISFVRFILSILIILFYKKFEDTGRKKLLLISLIGMCVSSFVIAITFLIKEPVWINYITMAFFVISAIFFSIGLGPIPFLIISELFGLNSSEKATSVAVFVNWTSDFVVSSTFPLINVYYSIIYYL